jgi:hypothetical protein
MYDSSADKMKPPRHPIRQLMPWDRDDGLTFTLPIRDRSTDRSSRRKEEQVDMRIRLGYN